jgi:DNA-directed RNA polymerase specialized sigma24 family protein
VVQTSSRAQTLLRRLPANRARVGGRRFQEDWEADMPNPVNARQRVPQSELCLYREHTQALLRRYLRLSLEVGRVPSVLGKEFFRTRATSYKLHCFEDAVIFVHDVERCLECLDEFSRQLIARSVLQDYSQEQTASLLGCTRRTVARRLPEALDELSGIFLERELMSELGVGRRRQARCQEAGSGMQAVMCSHAVS